jgi:hypothetical protein
MAFKPAPRIAEPLDASVVACRFAGLGANLAIEPAPNGPIEETLVAVSVLGMEEDDLRLLSLLADWIDHHGAYLYADRLFRCVSRESSVRVRAFWAAIGQQDRRLKRLTTLYTGPRLDLLHAVTELQVARRGEDPRFAGTPLRVPAGTLRKRENDLLSASALVAHHAGFRNRVQMGPSCRADLWTLLEAEPTLTPAEAARRAGCSFASAWQAVQDFALWRAGQAAR